MQRALTGALALGNLDRTRGIHHDAETLKPDDAVARVGDQFIAYSRLNSQLNSAAVVGLSVPVPGSHERNTLLLGQLCKAIDFNLLYLDALEEGKGRDRRYLKALKTFSDAERRFSALYSGVDDPIARRNRAGGRQHSDADRERFLEFRKDKLVNLHRNDLIRSMYPTDEDVRVFHRQHKTKIAFREQRRIQMLVLPTKEQAEVVKAQIGTGAGTVDAAARRYSIDPKAQYTMGDFGWVIRGSGHPPLDELVFALKPGVLGGPVASPAGWHLIRVVEVREGLLGELEEARTRETARRLLTEKRLHDYLVDLRETRFPVVIYEYQLRDLFQEGVRWTPA